MVERAWALWAISLLLVVPLSGCFGSNEAAPVAPGAAGARIDATMGALVGHVLSASLEPIAGATVIVMNNDTGAQARTTDSQGRFVVDALEPETYVIQAAAIGYQPGQARAVVQADTITEARMLLEATASSDPFSVPKDFAGFMSIGFATLDGSAAFSGQGLDSNHDTTFDVLVVPRDLETLIIEMEWRDESLLLQMDVWAKVDCTTACHPEVDLGNAQGAGEIVVRIDRPEEGWQGLNPLNETIWLFVWTTSNNEQPASAGYQVAFDVYTEAFYHAPAPAGHRVRADG